MRSKISMFVALMAVLSMILTACQPAPAATPETIVKTVIVEGQTKEIVVTATPAPEAAKPAAAPAKKVIKAGLLGVGDVPNVDPSLSEDTSSIQVVEETFIGLTRLHEETNETQPGMATKWDISEDGLTYTFHLRTDVPWVKYDGTKDEVVKVQACDGKTDRMVTADDFYYGMTRTLNPATASPYAFLLNNVVVGAEDYSSGKEKDATKVGIKVVDPATIEIKFKSKAAYNAAIAGLWMARAEPKWLIDGDDCTTARKERWGETGFFQSYGPFTIKEWIHDSTMTLVKNPFWPGSDAIPVSKIDEVVMPMLDDPAAFSDYEANNMDTARVPLADMDRVKSDATLSKELTIAPSLCTYYYGFNIQAPVVDDVRVRLALSEAIDRQSLIDNVTKGDQEPAQWFSRPGLAAAPTMDKFPDLGVKYNPEDAKKQLQSYLDEKKLTADKLEITLMFNTNAGHQKIAETIQQMWKDTLGINVKLTNQEWKVYLVTTKDPKNTPQVFRLGWCMDYPDANNWLKDQAAVGGNQNPKGPNGGGFNWKNDDYEKLMNDALAEQDPAKRTDLYAKAEDILVKQDVVLAPIYWYTRVVVTKPYVTRTFAASDGQDRLEKWDIDMSAKPQ
jgi:oligopeptide transport system substrate-binding protein